MNRYTSLAFIFTAVISSAIAYHPVLADNIRPAYLEIEEFKPGAIRVVWKVPLNQIIPQRFMPSLPESFKLSSSTRKIQTPDAMIEKWTMVGVESALAGATIGIEGLEETVMDVLVRVELSNGITHRAVLRPTEKSTTIPESFSMDKDDDQPFRVLGYLTAPWRYSLLLVAAWLLSLTPMARKRGILFCAVALAAGCLCGYSIGKLPIVENISTSRLITDTEAKRIVQGLMLNTYRAFILDKDEEVYDVLDRSVEKAFLSEVYLQSKEALGSGATKGTMSIVDRLDVTSIESMKLLKDDAVAMIARWDVYGSVRHGDHIHYRCNTYKAELVIVPTADYWKIITLQLLDEDRVI